MGKREERIYKTIENPSKLSDYALIEGRKANRAKGTKRGHKYRWFIPGLLLFTVIVTVTLSILFL